MKQTRILGIVIIILLCATFVLAEPPCGGWLCPGICLQDEEGGVGCYECEIDDECEGGFDPPEPPGDGGLISCGDYPACFQVLEECQCDPNDEDNIANEGELCYMIVEDGSWITGNVESDCYNNHLYNNGEYPDNDADGYFDYDRISDTSLFPLYTDLLTNNLWFQEFINRLTDPDIIGLADCNDNDANVNPGVNEIPDNDIDDNCDGIIDDEGVGSEGNYVSAGTILTARDENDNPMFYVCGGTDIELADFDFASKDASIQPYYTIKNFCDTVIIDIGVGTKTYQCSPISQGGSSFYHWEELYDGKYMAVPFMGTIVEGVETFGNDIAAGDSIWYTDGESFSQTQEDGYAQHIWETAECVAPGQLAQTDESNEELMVSVLYPEETTTDDLAAGILSNMVELNIKANIGGADIPQEMITYELSINIDGVWSSMYSGTVCNTEEAGETEEGKPCSSPTGCDPTQGYECDLDLGECVLIDEEEPVETLVACDPSQNSLILHLGRGYYSVALEGVKGEMTRNSYVQIRVNKDGQFSPDFSEQGSCPGDQCFYGYANNVPECKDQGFYEYDYLCSRNTEGEAEWSTRTSVIASTLKMYADSSAVGAKPYSLICNEEAYALNEYLASGEQTNFCVLNIYDNHEIEDTVIGVGITTPIYEPEAAIAYVLKDMDIGATRVQDSSLFVDACDNLVNEDVFNACSGKKLWYNPALQIAIYSRETVELDGDNSVFDNIIDFFENLFGDPQTVDGAVASPPISRKADNIYYAQDAHENKVIYGGVEYMNYQTGGEGFIMSETLALMTDGFGNLCDDISEDDDNYNSDDFRCHYPQTGSDKTQFLISNPEDSLLTELAVPLVFY